MSDTIPSTDDARAANSPVRHAYRVLSEAEKARVEAIKDLGQAFLDELAPHQGRDFDVARIKIKEAVMWAVSGITA